MLIKSHSGFAPHINSANKKNPAFGERPLEIPLCEAAELVDRIVFCRTGPEFRRLAQLPLSIMEDYYNTSNLEKRNMALRKALSNIPEIKKASDVLKDLYNTLGIKRQKNTAYLDHTAQARIKDVCGDNVVVDADVIAAEIKKFEKGISV